jgi:signal transduction histidine kinase
MNDLKTQIVSGMLVILTATLVICAALNYQQQELFRLPEDGVTWKDDLDASSPDKSISVIAMHVTPGGPGDVAGIRLGDELLRIGGRVNKPGVVIHQSTDVTQVLERVGAWGAAEYVLNRNGVEITAKVIVSDATRDRALLYQYAVGAAYLIIGLFLFFRRNRAAHSLHFYLLCLASFVQHTFHYTGKFNNFDTFIFSGNVVAGVVAPTLFVHFCLTFPEPRKRWSKWKAFSLYLPALSLLGLYFGVTSEVLRAALPDVLLRYLLDRIWLLCYCAAFVFGALLLHLSYRRTDDPIVRQQLKWLRNGTLAGMGPFIACYAVPFIAGIITTPEMRLAVLALALIPITWAYAILRYRLMDVDIIFQQGYVYLLATLAVLGVVSMLVFALSQRESGLSPTAVILLVLVAAFVFEPLRGWIQQNFDRYVFYKDRWDYRRTLIGFARELSSEMDLDRTLASVGLRLIETLSVREVAFFLVDETAPGGYQLHSRYSREGREKTMPDGVTDLSFLGLAPSKPYLFFERTQHAFDVLTSELPPSVRETIARLDLTYYIPCEHRGRTLAWFGLSRTEDGDFLSSDDIELLQTLSGYLAMAVENARLYRSLADKALQYEQLKEFNENIVESINVGVMVVGLNDRVEGWNTPLERLTGVARQMAIGRELTELMPAEITSHLDALRDSREIHHLYRIALRPDELPLPGDVIAINGDTPPAEARREVTVNIAIAPLVTREGSYIGRLVIFDDITEREELERKLVQADKLSSIGLLAAGVAHEVNTPLTGISSFTQMLLEGADPDDPRTRLLEKIERQSFRAAKIVNGLLNLSRPAAQAAERAPVDLNAVVTDVLALLEHQFKVGRIQVRRDLGEPAPVVLGAEFKLQQVFLNLFLNARDAMPHGGWLSVRTRAASGAAVVEVGDTGAGIPSECLARIYDPFFTTKEMGRGTGLGLSITYGIVREHDGTIACDSTVGVGTRFTLSFPLAAPAASAPRADAAV